MTEIRKERERIRLVSVYGVQGGKSLGEKLEKFVGEVEEGNLIIGGDFNIRIGELDGRDIEEGDIIERYSKDKVIGNGGRNLIEWVIEKGWYILNGTMEGDWEGEYTYVGARGCSVIDYIVVNENVRDKICNFRIGDRVDSDHLPLEMEVIEEEGRDLEEEEERKKEEMEIIVWDREAIEVYEERTEELCEGEELGEKEEDTIEEKWEKIKKIVHEAMIKKKIRKKKIELGHKD